MLRQLLTLLALITGLAATSAPVEARTPAVNGAQIEIADVGASAIAAELATRSVSLAVVGYSAPQTQEFALPEVEWRASTVLYGPDRARE